MQLFGEQLAQARKAHGMTQSQLANEMGVSRQMISRWENGSAQPDEEAQKRLMALLFSAKGNASQEASCQPTQNVSPKADARRLSGWRLLLVMALVLLLAAALLYGVIRGLPSQVAVPTSVPGPSADAFLPTVHSFEWYQQPAVNEAGKPYLLLTPDHSPVKLFKQPDIAPGYAWDVRFSIHEVNNCPFTLTKFTELYFNSEHGVSYSCAHSDEECADFFMSAQLPAGFSTGYNVRRPVCGDIGYAASFEGTDSNGNALEFWVYIPLSQEVEEELTPEAFRATAERRAGAAYIELLPKSNPLELVEDPGFDGDWGWEVAFMLKNTGESDFTPSSMVWALFSDDMLCNTWTDDAAYFAEALPDGVLSCDGEPFGLGSRVSLQPFTHVGVRMTGTDAAGNELSFATLVPLMQDITPEAFQSSSEHRAGAAYIEFAPEDNPIPLVDDPDFAGGKGWMMGMLLANTGESDFHPSSMTWALFNENRLCELWTYDADFFAEALEGGALIHGGEPLGMGSGACFQALTHLGVKLFGTDTAGNELAFAALIPLAQE